jgi:hypothetical protein
VAKEYNVKFVGWAAEVLEAMETASRELDQYQNGQPSVALAVSGAIASMVVVLLQQPIPESLGNKLVEATSRLRVNTAIFKAGQIPSNFDLGVFVEGEVNAVAKELMN